LWCFRKNGCRELIEWIHVSDPYEFPKPPEFPTPQNSQSPLKKKNFFWKMCGILEKGSLSRNKGWEIDGWGKCM
jgi:hypothetical protein